LGQTQHIPSAKFAFGQNIAMSLSRMDNFSYFYLKPHNAIVIWQFYILKMEAVAFSKTLVNIQRIMWHHIQEDNNIDVGFEVLTAVVLKSYIFWDTMLCYACHLLSC
jgi:hypothetical protein